MAERRFRSRAGSIVLDALRQRGFDGFRSRFVYARRNLLGTILMQYQLRNATLTIGIKADLRVNHRCKELRLAFRKELDVDLPGQACEKMVAITNNGENYGRSQLVIADIFVKMRWIERHHVAWQCLFRAPLCIQGR